MARKNKTVINDLDRIMNNEHVISMRELERRYNKLLKDVETEEFYDIDLHNRVNCYKCKECGHVTKTIDVDKGVTPFMHSCESCGSSATSSFYKDIAPNQEPTQEWYRPTLKQMKKYRRHPEMLGHILDGGLQVRNIKETI